MKNIKRVLALALSAMIIALCFAGCSSASEEAEEIDDKTLLIAYTEEVKPFIYTENGKLTGFDVDVMTSIFKSIKNDYKTYKFVKVDEGYKLGEDPAYTDDDGNSYVAYIQVGGLQKNSGTFNEDYTMTESIIDNRVITIVDSVNDKISTYADLAGAKVGVVSQVAMNALDKHTAIKSGLKSVTAYEDANTALADLKAGKLDAVVIDEFSFCVLEDKDSYIELNGELDTINYVYGFKKWDWYNDSVNEAIKELKSPDYNDADELTPIVEKYFGYNASNFTYESVSK